MVPQDEAKWLHQYLDTLEKDIREIKQCLASMKSVMDQKYLTKDEFKATFTPVRLLLYGAVGAILTWAAAKLGVILK